MLRWAIRKIGLDHIRNEDIRKEAHIRPVENVLDNNIIINCSIQHYA